jgi:tetratricopeptide (TPR) repeat protein
MQMQKFVTAIVWCGVAFWMSAFPLTAAMAAGESVTPERFQKVEKLLEESSAATRIKEGGNSQAQAKREEAKVLLAQARSAFDAGDPEQADQLLQRATTVMLEAVRMVAPDQSMVDKKYRDFDERLESIEALSAAHARIREEKGLTPASESDLYPLVERKLAQAKALREQGKPEDGRRILDEAYVAAKVAIEHLRGGDTLVRSLHFATKEEEYRYELDRNDTHHMLVGVLVKEGQQASAGVDKLVQQFMAKAKRLRQQAEQQAQKGAYEEAIHSLEQSTKEIVRAIRSAGIYIPG